MSLGWIKIMTALSYLCLLKYSVLKDQLMSMHSADWFLCHKLFNVVKLYEEL